MFWGETRRIWQASAAGKERGGSGEGEAGQGDWVNNQRSGGHGARFRGVYFSFSFHRSKELLYQENALVRHAG